MSVYGIDVSKDVLRAVTGAAKPGVKYRNISGGDAVYSFGVDMSPDDLPGETLIGEGLEFNAYPELVHFREVYDNMNTHPEPKVREKYLTTWNMYSLAYPGLTRSLIKHNFDPCGMADSTGVKQKKWIILNENEENWFCKIRIRERDMNMVDKIRRIFNS
jgi:hypothetical protein